MKNDLTKYETLRPQLRPGDLIAFQGAGILSGLISVFSAGPSHIGIVRQSCHANSDFVTMTESTIEGGRNGVQTNRLSERLAEYDGRAWWLPLSDDIHEQIDWFKFFNFIGATEDHVRYDTTGLFEFILRGLPIVGPRIGQKEHVDQMVCSGFVTAVLESCGVLRGINWSKVSPQDLVEMHIYRDVFNLIGGPAKLRGFNTV